MKKALPFSEVEKARLFKLVNKSGKKNNFFKEDKTNG